ncbi:MAG: hypothetical protein AAGJ83_13675, partial [Planctomycetota bacterium]
MGMTVSLEAIHAWFQVDATMNQTTRVRRSLERLEERRLLSADVGSIDWAARCLSPVVSGESKYPADAAFDERIGPTRIKHPTSNRLFSGSAPSLSILDAS